MLENKKKRLEGRGQLIRDIDRKKDNLDYWRKQDDIEKNLISNVLVM